MADVVEYRYDAQGQCVMPVEYKHGRPSGQVHEADSIQLCAQAFCLEEMRQCHIPCGCLYYHSIRRRVEVLLDPALRERTCQAILETRQLLQSRALPQAARKKECDACSLADICLPASASRSAQKYNEQSFAALLS